MSYESATSHHQSNSLHQLNGPHESHHSGVNGPNHFSLLVASRRHFIVKTTLSTPYPQDQDPHTGSRGAATA